MKIEYSNGHVRKCFEDFGYMQKRYGVDIARGAKKLHNILTAAGNFSMYLETNLGKPHRLSGDMSRKYGLSITANYRLIISPIIEELTDAELKKCTTITVEGVIDYHGEKYEWLIS